MAAFASPPPQDRSHSFFPVADTFDFDQHQQALERIPLTPSMFDLWNEQDLLASRPFLHTLPDPYHVKSLPESPPIDSAVSTSRHFRFPPPTTLSNTSSVHSEHSSHRGSPHTLHQQPVAHFPHPTTLDIETPLASSTFDCAFGMGMDPEPTAFDNYGLLAGENSSGSVGEYAPFSSNSLHSSAASCAPSSTSAGLLSVNVLDGPFPSSGSLAPRGFYDHPQTPMSASSHRSRSSFTPHVPSLDLGEGIPFVSSPLSFPSSNTFPEVGFERCSLSDRGQHAFQLPSTFPSCSFLSFVLNLGRFDRKQIC